MKKLQGRWTGRCAEMGRKDAGVVGVNLTLQQEQFTLTYVLSHGDGEMVFQGTCKIDPSKSPKAIDMTITERVISYQGSVSRKSVAGKDLHGIYEMGQNSLKLCIGEVSDKERPKKFADQLDRQFLFTFERQSDQKADSLAKH
jgi:uncharacterized protein (TIGR03067 family)